MEPNTPRSAIKEGFKAEMISDEEEWIEMLVDRNKNCH